MSQLSFVDIFDMARESAGGCCVTQDAQAGNGYFPSVHRLMSAQCTVQPEPLYQRVQVHRLPSSALGSVQRFSVTRCQ